MDILNAKQVEVIYSGATAPAVKGVDLTIQQGKITVLLGSSGSGKSTLLRSFTGLKSLSKGDIELGGKCIASLGPVERVQKVAFVAQDYQLFPHMTVIENCMHPQQTVLKRDSVCAKERAEELLQQLNIERLSSRYPYQLSGGQKQRVAIARALAMGSHLLLMDEPSSALDPHSTEVLANLLRSLCKQGISIVVATHDMDFAASIMEAIIVMQEGEVIYNQKNTGDVLLEIKNIKEIIKK